MAKLFRVPAVLTAVFVGILLAACGGGGDAANNNSNGGNGNAVITLPSQEKTAKFTAQPHQTTIQPIGDVSVVISAGSVTAPTQVTVARSQPTTLPQFAGFTAANNAELKVSFSDHQSGQIEIKPLDQPASRGLGTTVWGYLTGSDRNWHLTSALSAIAMTAMVEVDETLGGIIGSFIVSPIDSTTGLKKLATNPAGNELSALILVHGFNGRVEDMELAATKFNGYLCEDEPSVIYGFEYDYRQHCADSAQKLANLINDLSYANIYITAHSAGVVVVRDMIENGRCHANIVDSVNLVNGANFGSIWANGAEFAKTLEEGVLNNHPASAGSLLALANDPIISDLARRSPYLTELNNRIPPQPARAAYLLIGSTGDAVVGVDSGLGTDIPFERMISGSVNRMTSSGSHTYLIETNAGLDALLDAVYHGWGSYFWATTYPENDVYTNTDGWGYYIVLDNRDGSDEVIVNDIAADVRDSDNTPMGYRWLDWTGRYQSEYTSLDLTVPVGETRRIDVHEPIENTRTLLARTDWLVFDRAHKINVRYTVNDRQMCWLTFVRLHE